MSVTVMKVIVMIVLTMFAQIVIVKTKVLIDTYQNRLQGETNATFKTKRIKCERTLYQDSYIAING